MKKEIIKNVKGNLKRKRAVATGIGLFAAVYKESGKILLIIRKEKGSIIYGKDLTNKWEFPGGGLELSDLTEDYQGQILNCLKRELEEEAGIKLQKIKEIVMLPAWLSKKGLIDLAFVVPVPFDSVKETGKSQLLLEANEAAYLDMKEIEKKSITSQRMKFMISEAFKYLLNKF